MLIERIEQHNFMSEEPTHPPPPYNEFEHPNSPSAPPAPTTWRFPPNEVAPFSPEEHEGTPLTRSKPKTYIWFSVLTCTLGLLCLWIAPLMALYYSCKVSTHYRKGELVRAKMASRAALCMNCVSVCNGCLVVLALLVVVIVFLVKIFERNANNPCSIINCM